MSAPMFFDNTPMAQYSSTFDDTHLAAPYDSPQSSTASPVFYHWNDNNNTASRNIMSDFPQGYNSGLRTTIVDSPPYQAQMLPTPPMSATSHVPRGLMFMPPGSPASTDSDDGAEPTASTQWINYNTSYTARYAHSGHHPHSRSSTATPDYPSLSVQIPNFIQAQQRWSSLMPDSTTTPSDNSISINGYLLQSMSPIQTPSPPTYTNTLPIPATTKNTSLPSNRAGRDANGVKRCSHCQATSTPLWRRDTVTFKPLCNACGLYMQQRNRPRPQVLIDADNDDGNASEESDANYVGPECSHCRTHNTSVWRRSKTGAQLCNACGVYIRLRGKPRPLHLKKNKIKPRSKHPKD